MLAYIRRTGGNINRMSREIPYDQKWIYKLIYRMGLEGEVARARQKARAQRRKNEPEWLRQTRAVLAEVAR